jgi:hypothetical protein
MAITMMTVATTTITQPTTSFNITGTMSRTGSTASNARQWIIDRLNTAIQWSGGGGRGGGEGNLRGSEGSGDSEGGPPAAAPAANLAAPVPPATNVRTMGILPAIFTGDRTKAQDFLDELWGYFRANQVVAGFDSFIWRVAIMLTLIKGQAIAGWTCNMEDWIDRLNPL